MTVAKTLKTLMLTGIATVALSASAMAADMTLKLGHPAMRTTSGTRPR